MSRLSFLLGVSILISVSSVPQYGGGSQSQVSVPAPAPVSSPSCWTEQNTVWETQYVDTVTQECRPVTKQECSPVTKQEPQRVSKSVPKQVCDDGGSYGSQPQVVQSQGGGYSGGSSSGGGYGGGSSSGGGYGGGSSSAPRGKTRTGSGAKLRTGGASSDAVNFGK